MAADPEPSSAAAPASGAPVEARGFALASLLLAVLLAAVARIHWKIAVVDPAYSSQRATDLFKEHMPTVIAGFGAWRDGRLALWNPDQLTGIPFLAVPYTGLLYPGNLALLLSDNAAFAIDATQLAHLVFGGLCMAWLVRALALGWVAAVASALTFMFSGWMAELVSVPVLIHGMSWLPATVLAVERTLQGGRLAPVALALAVAMQVLNGASEYLAYNVFAAGLYALIGVASGGQPGRAAAKVLALLAMCVGLGGALAGPQLLPSLELVSLSARAGGVDLAEALYAGTLPLDELAWLSATTAGVVSVGILPMIGLCLGLGDTRRRYRGLWLYALLLAAGSALLAAGGAVYEIYFETPFGHLFRRPNKLLHLYSFAAALLAAIAIARLDSWRNEGRVGAALWTSPDWLAALGVVALACCWVVAEGARNPPLLAGLAALLLFGLLPTRGARALLIVVLLCVHGWDVLATGRASPERPSARPDLLDRDRHLFEWLEAHLGGARVHLSADFRLDHGLTLKQGMLRGIPVLMDKQALTTGRHRDFLRLASGGSPVQEGQVTLQSNARLELLDLASVRFYVLSPGAPFERHLASLAGPRGSRVRPVKRTGHYIVYEREGWLPRAYAVPYARTLASPDEVLAALAQPDFDARREVLIESHPRVAPALGAHAEGGPLEATVRILSDEPERLVIEAELDRPGYLVVTDSWYPGWRATVDGAVTTILRANHLFRSVPLAAGSSRVVFEYAPTSFRAGLVVSALAALALAGLALRPPAFARAPGTRPVPRPRPSFPSKTGP